MFNGKIGFKRPLRNFRTALIYWFPKRLTMNHNLRVHAWLWWNF